MPSKNRPEAPPKSRSETRLLVVAALLEKAVEELRREIDKVQAGDGRVEEKEAGGPDAAQ